VDMSSPSAVNHYARLRPLADDIAREFSHLPEVIGIIFLGGLARQFMDESSDLDITVIVENDHSKERALGKAREVNMRRSPETDVEVYRLGDFEHLSWSDIERWSYSKSEIVLDREGEVRRVLEGKLAAPQDFWKKRVITMLERLSWYNGVDGESEGMITTWIRRNDPVSGHVCANHALDMLVDLLFALNREYTPPAKWEIAYSRKLEWLPPRYPDLLEEVLTVKNLGSRDLIRRMASMWSMYEPAIRRAVEVTGMSVEETHRYFVEVVLMQS